MRKFNAVHELDRRELLIWGAPITTDAFLDDYSAEREFWEAGGLKKGQMDSFILYHLAKKHSAKAVEAAPEEVSEVVPDKTARKRKEPQPA